jgi:hypothetical protein
VIEQEQGPILTLNTGLERRVGNAGRVIREVGIGKAAGEIPYCRTLRVKRNRVGDDLWDRP